MKFHWWWIFAPPATIWLAGWFVTVIVAVFFNPLDSDKDRRGNFCQRLLGHCILNLFVWPQMLSGLSHRRKFLLDLRTGKIPGWAVREHGELDVNDWKLSDGTQFAAMATSGEKSSEPTVISADYEDESLTGDIQYCVRMLAPTPGLPTEWASLKFTPRDLLPTPEDEDDVADRWKASVKLDRGKYVLAFRVPNRAGKIEECSGLILIVTDPDDHRV
jgi:hypothetical protein